MKFTAQEIHHLNTTVNRFYGNVSNPIWQKAFKFYNANNYPVRMSCAPCYINVLKWVSFNFDKDGNRLLLIA